jgi:hypothetical protein
MSNSIKGGSSIGDLALATTCIAKSIFNVTADIIDIPLSLAS